MIRLFNDARALDAALVGGKAASLARLTLAGFRVPPGFMVSTTAQARFFAAHGIAEKIHAQLVNLGYDNAVALDGVAANMRTLIESYPLAPSFAAQIAQHCSALGDAAFVAVRSSGTAEDLAAASFAGLHDTYLDVRGVDAVLEAVRRCWASMWTARAMAYRQRGGFDHATAQIAVMV